MTNLQYNLESGGGVSSGGGANFQPPVEGTSRPVLYPLGPVIGFHHSLAITYTAHHSSPYYFNPLMFPPQITWNLSAVPSTPSPANQYGGGAQYWRRRQTYSNHAASPSYASVLMQNVPGVTGSAISIVPHDIYYQNWNQQYQINDNHYNVWPDEEVVILDGEMDETDDDDEELDVAMLESESNYILYRGRDSGLPENIISNYLKTRKFTHQDSSSCDICVICQDVICLNENDDEGLIATLDCGHEFHVDCIKQWLKQKNICPLCKAKALPLNC